MLVSSRIALVITFVFALLIAPLSASEKRDWNKASRENTTEAYRKFLDKYPKSPFAAEANNRIERLEAEAAPCSTIESISIAESRTDVFDLVVDAGKELGYSCGPKIKRPTEKVVQVVLESCEGVWVGKSEHYLHIEADSKGGSIVGFSTSDYESKAEITAILGEGGQKLDLSMTARKGGREECTRRLEQFKAKLKEKLMPIKK